MVKEDYKHSSGFYIYGTLVQVPSKFCDFSHVASMECHAPCTNM